MLKVKTLTWEKPYDNDYYVSNQLEVFPFACAQYEYGHMPNMPKCYARFIAGSVYSVVGDYDTLEEAQKACQAHYKNWILGQLDLD